jgi:hypothetical protein
VKKTLKRTDEGDSEGKSVDESDERDLRDSKASYSAHDAKHVLFLAMLNGVSYRDSAAARRNYYSSIS